MNPQQNNKLTAIHTNTVCESTTKQYIYSNITLFVNPQQNNTFIAIHTNTVCESTTKQ